MPEIFRKPFRNLIWECVPESEHRKQTQKRGRVGLGAGQVRHWVQNRETPGAGRSWLKGDAYRHHGGPGSGWAFGDAAAAPQVIQQALHRQPNTAAQYLQQMYAAQQQHLMLQTAALQQQHLTSAQLQSLAAVQQVRHPPCPHPARCRGTHGCCGFGDALPLLPQASLAANRQSGSSGANGTQAAPAQQPTVSLRPRKPRCRGTDPPAQQPSLLPPPPSLQINLATSPAAAQLLNRAQSVAPGASGIAQQAVLLGNAASPALTASQAQMYLRAQMVRGALLHGAGGWPGPTGWPAACREAAGTHRVPAGARHPPRRNL